MRKLFNDEAGFVVSAELALIVTLIFTAVAVGVAVARDSLVNEYNDISEMIGVVDQSWNVNGTAVSNGGATGTHPNHGENNAMGFNDEGDVCDCKAVTYKSICGKDQTGGSGAGEDV
jgi:hypothetical protein